MTKTNIMGYKLKNPPWKAGRYRIFCRATDAAVPETRLYFEPALAFLRGKWGAIDWIILREKWRAYVY